MAPECLNRYIQRQDSNRVTRSKVNDNCKILYLRSTFGQLAFSIKVRHLWNTLPTDIKLITDIRSFTLKVKVWLKGNQRCSNFI